MSRDPRQEAQRRIMADLRAGMDGFDMTIKSEANEAAIKAQATRLGMEKFGDRFDRAVLRPLYRCPTAHCLTESLEEGICLIHDRTLYDCGYDVVFILKTTRIISTIKVA